MYYCYIIENDHNRLYVGSTRDVGARLKRHNSGHGAKYTAYRPNYRLVYSEAFESLTQARAREAQIKKWSRVKKLALVDGRLHDLVKYSKSKSLSIDSRQICR